MARMIVLTTKGQPIRAFHEEAKAQEHVQALRSNGVEGELLLWDVPVGRSIGDRVKIDEVA